MILVYVAVKILLIGYTIEKGKPITGWRAPYMKYPYIFLGYYISFCCGLSSSKTIVKQQDYSFYLGPDYMKDIKPKFVSIFVSNHISWIDIMVFIAQYSVTFASKKEIKRIPIAGYISKVRGCIYITREGNEEKRLGNIEKIKKRQLAIEKDGLYPMFCVFAEGGTTNGQCLIPFKRGAFVSECTLTPTVLKYHHKMLNPAYDCVQFFPLVFFQMSLLYSAHCEIVELPSFTPNEYLFKTHADKGRERWEIYAWAVRQVMAEGSGLKLAE